MLKYGQTYIEQGIEAYDKKYNETMVKKLKKHASILGFDLVKIEPIL
ncbi:MAG: hypothetical protein RCG15_07875 [Candidatus Rickettsia vulgarisii]